MATAIKMQTINLFKGAGYLNADNIEDLTLEIEEGSPIDLVEILANMNGKFVEISIKATENDEVPYVDSNNNDNDKDFIDEDTEVEDE